MENILRELTVEWVLGYMLVFCRVGSVLMLIPGIGESYVSFRMRLALALMLSLVILPLVAPSLPTKVPDSIVQLLMWMLPEILVGLAIGMIARLLLSTLHVAGMIIAYQTGLASALLFDANTGGQGSAIGNLYTMVGLLLLFETNVHHTFLQGIAYSYQLFHFGSWLPVADMGQMATQMLSDSFMLAMQISSPFLVVGTVFFLGAGVLSRLMPNMNIFFVSVPLQVMLGFFILLATFTVCMSWWVDTYQETISSFLSGSYVVRD